MDVNIKFGLVLLMAIYSFHIFIVLMLLFRARVASLKKKEMKFSYFQTYQGTIPATPQIRSRHFDNQFQAPMLFFFLCLAALATNVGNMALLILLSSFVVFRLIHSFIHLGKNDIKVRAMFYTLSWIVLLVSWIYLVLLNLPN